MKEKISLPLRCTVFEVYMLNWVFCGYFYRISLLFPLLALPHLVFPAALIVFDISCIYPMAYLHKIIFPLLHFHREDKKQVSASNHPPRNY